MPSFWAPLFTGPLQVAYEWVIRPSVHACVTGAPCKSSARPLGAVLVVTIAGFMVYAFCFLSVLSPWWGVAELFCTISLWHLRAVSGAQINSELTGALGDAVVCTWAQRSSSKPARGSQSVSGTSLAVCLSAAGSFQQGYSTKVRLCCSGIFLLAQVSFSCNCLTCWL